jgi:hypothetical protein
MQASKKADAYDVGYMYIVYLCILLAANFRAWVKQYESVILEQVIKLKGLGHEI